MNIEQIIEQQKKEFDEKVKELKDQRPPHLRESEPVEFGYTVDRDDEIFRVVDFGNIKKWHTSSLRKILEAIVEREEGEIKKADKFAPFQRIHHVEAKQDTIDYLKEVISINR